MKIDFNSILLMIICVQLALSYVRQGKRYEVSCQ